jgi:hypothetical protein
MSELFYDGLVDYKKVSDNIVLYDAACGLQYGIDEANRRGLLSQSDNVSKSLEQALSHVKIEWIEE